MKSHAQKVIEVTGKLLDAKTIYKCANCDWHTYEGIDLEPCSNLVQRLEAGDRMPDGDCPQCGAFCYGEVIPPFDMEVVGKLARETYSGENIDIDNDLSPDDFNAMSDGVWVRAWVRVSNKMLKEHGIANPEAL